MDVGSLAFRYKKHRSLLVTLIFACFRRHISSSKSPVSLQAPLLCLVEHTVNLVTCQNQAFGADPLHYLSDMIRRSVFLTVIFCCISNNIISSCFLGPVMILYLHMLLASELFLLIQLSELKPLQHEDKLLLLCLRGTLLWNEGEIDSQTDSTHCGGTIDRVLLCRAGTLLRTWH